MAQPLLEANSIQKYAGANGTTLTESSNFDEQRISVNPEPSEHALKAAMGQYQALDCRPKLDFDANDCSWTEVFRLLENAQEGYAAKARKGLKGSLRRMGRGAGEYSDTIKPFLGIIPDEFGGSIIRSGLGWLFTVARECTKARDEIFELFAEIPLIIQEIVEARNHLKQDSVLMRLAKSAEVEILNATLKLIKFLLPKHQLEKVFTIFSDVPSASSVSEIVANVRSSAQALKRRSDVLMKGVAIGTNRNTREVTREIRTTRHNTLMISERLEKVEGQITSLHQMVKDMHQDVHRSEKKTFTSLHQMVKDMHQDVHRSEKKTFTSLHQMVNDVHQDVHRPEKKTFISLHQMVNDIHQDVHRSEKKTLDAFATGIEAFNGLLRILREQREAVEARQACIQASIESGFTRAFQMGFNLEKHRAYIPQPMLFVLLSTDQMSFDLNLTSQQLVGDLEQVLRQGLRLDPLAMSQAQQLFRKDRFWSWFNWTSSDLIMIYARFTDRETLNRMSPLSATSGALITSILRERSDDIALHFFCGQHTSPRDTLAGPQGVMRCLLARLLVEVRVRSRFDLLLDPGSAHAIVEDIRRYNMEAMCFVFQSVIAHVPQGTTVFCIVDGLSWLDQPNYVSDTLRMIQLFRSLVSDPALRCLFKVMLTGPWYSEAFNAAIIPEEQINLVRGALMKNTGAESPFFNRHTLSPSQYESRLFQNR